MIQLHESPHDSSARASRRVPRLDFLGDRSLAGPQLGLDGAVLSRKGISSNNPAPFLGSRWSYERIRRRRRGRPRGYVSMLQTGSMSREREVTTVQCGRRSLVDRRAGAGSTLKGVESFYRSLSVLDEYWTGSNFFGNFCRHWSVIKSATMVSVHAARGKVPLSRVPLSSELNCMNTDELERAGSLL